MASIYHPSAPNGWSVDSITGKFVNGPPGSPDSAGSASTQTPAPVVQQQAPAQSSGSSSASGTTKVSRQGSTIDILNADLPYYLKQGWTQETQSGAPAPQQKSALDGDSTFILANGSVLGFKDWASAEAYIKENNVKNVSSVSGSFEGIKKQYGEPADMTSYVPKGSTSAAAPVKDSAAVDAASAATKSTANYSDLPANILNSPDWLLLPDDMKQTWYLTYKYQRLTDEQSKLDFLDALKKAEAVADPQLKEALRISQDELTQGISSLQGDFNSKKSTLENRIKNLEEDLTYNKGEISLDEQADLANQLQAYKSDLYNIQQSAAESGLAFSSPRTTAEAQRSLQNEGLVTSTQRAYAQRQRNLQTESARAMAENQQSIADLQRQQQENLLKLQRAGETTMGSANVGQVPGVNPLGNIVGALPEKKQTDVVNLATKTFSPAQDVFNYIKT